MITATCIQKFYKNNRIYGYRLQDSRGAIKDVYADPLKQAIRSQQITVLNLTITSDNRLVDTTPTQPTQPKVQKHSQKLEEQKIKNLIIKAKTLGTIKEIPTYCCHHCTLISKSDTQHIIYIPDDVTWLNGDYLESTFTKHIQKLQGTLKVIGGHNLKDISYMFYECQVQSLDLSSFDTSKVTDMSGMFYKCKAQAINLSSFNTSNVTVMYRMFDMCRAKILDLSSFDTSKVYNMEFMFHDCQVQFIDLSSFDISNPTVMYYMFYECKAQIKATDPKILEAYNNR